MLSQDKSSYDQGNGDVIRRQIRTTSVTQPTVPFVKPMPQQQKPIFFISSQSSHISSNGNLNHVAHSEDDTLRPMTTIGNQGNQSIPLQFNLSSPQRIEPFNMSKPRIGGNLSISPSRPVPLEIVHEPTLANGHRKNLFGNDTQIDNNRFIDSSPYYGIYSSLAGTIAVGFGASIMALLSFQLLLSLNYYESPTLSGVQLPEGSTPQVLRDLSTALCTITLTCSLCAIMSSFLHFYLCLRIIGHSQTTTELRKRIDLYRRRNVYIRALSNGGFFISIIIFMIALITYQQLLSTAFGSTISSSVVTIITGIGVLFCTMAILIAFCSAGLCRELRPSLSSSNNPTLEKRGTLV